jgi:two-component system cell cycle sensor histidine kinase/response regulator CckA
MTSDLQHPERPLTSAYVHRILLVEDEKEIRRLMADALQAEGFAVFEAGSGEEALELLDRSATTIDMMIADVYMPGMNGAQLSLKVRQRTPRPTVLFISGRIGDLGTEHYLAKPFSMPELVARVPLLLKLEP